MKDNVPYDYTRQNLRKATKFTEGDYRGINPREFFRSLKRSLEEIQSDNDFKYTTFGDQNSSFSIDSEEVGSKTGRVEGRLMAKSDTAEIGSGSINYKPYGPWGAVLILAGLITSIFLVGLLIIPIGIYLYLKDTRGDLPLQRQDVIRTLMSGEVSERTIEEESEERTDIFANLSVIYAGDAFITIDTDEFEEFGLAHRKEIVGIMTEIFNKVVEEEELKRETNSGMIGEFIGHTKAVANMDVQDDVQEVEEMQQILNDNFEYRLDFSERLLNYLPTNYEKELEEHQESLMDELEYLSEDMDVYVEREGMEVK